MLSLPAKDCYKMVKACCPLCTPPEILKGNIKPPSDVLTSLDCQKLLLLLTLRSLQWVLGVLFVYVWAI